MTERSFLPTGKLPMEFLSTMLDSCLADDPRLIAGPCVGEDVAVIDMGDRYLVVKTDPITFATDEIGWYAVHVNANDIATSGGVPRWMLATVLLPEGRTTEEDVSKIFAQLNEACCGLGVTLVGGHTEVTADLVHPIVVGVMVGEVAKDALLTTAGACAGDRLLVAGSVPIEATALLARECHQDLLERGYTEEWIARAASMLHDPGISVVRVAEAVRGVQGVHSMHDPTEGGLATGIHEMAYASGNGALVDDTAIPYSPEGLALCKEYDLDPLGAIASGALLIAAAPESVSGVIAACAAIGVGCADIGELTEEQGCIWLLRNGERLPMPRYDSDEVTRVL